MARMKTTARRIDAVAAIAFALFSGGCTASRSLTDVYASKEQIAGATDGLVTCARREIMKLDDGVSSADVVAGAVAARCDDQFRLVYHYNVKGWTDRHYLAGFRETFTPERVFTPLVLSHRARKT